MKLLEGHIRIAPPANVAHWDIDPFDSSVLCSPLPYFRELRERGPFVYLEKYSMLACGRYAETKEVFSDWERFVSSRGVGLSDFKFDEPWRPPSIILEVDPPRHTTTRTVLTRALSPKRVKSMIGMFEQVADEMVGALTSGTAFDAIQELAEGFPTNVFPAAIGLKHPDRRKLLDYAYMVFNALGPDNELRQTTMARGQQATPWILQQCARDRVASDGLASAIYDAVDNGDIDEEEGSLLVRSLLSAGIDTTVSAIGNALWCLATHPEQFEILRSSPGLARNAFEETLRYASPIHSFCRTANADTTVSGIDIAEGSKVLCVLAAANLDPSHWEQPDEFLIDRQTTGHLALGVGIHSCVGQNVARAEGTAILNAVARQVKKIELVGDVQWRPNNAVRSLEHLPLKFHAA